jgi:RNA polymerase sigma factor (TIGR02999 family)
MSDVTLILDRVQQGDLTAADKLLPLVYEELRRLAAHKMAQEQAGQTLQPTALVHEAWLRLAGSHQPPWQNRGHFFGAAAEAMRRILIENARRKLAQKRGAGAVKVNVEDIDVAASADDETLLIVNEALQNLEREDARSAELIKLRFFTGLTNDEAAAVLGISERSAKRYWTFARAWLYNEIRRQQAP